MDLTIVAVYTICDDFLIAQGHQEHPLAKMSDAEVMTTALIAARYFGGNQHTACAALKTLGYIPNMLGHSRYNRRLHRVSAMFQTLFEYFAEVFKAENSNHIYSIDTYPVAVCDTIRISRSRLYQGENWRGKISSKHRYFYGIKAHLMVSETGHIVEAFLTPGRFSDVRGLGRYRFDLPPGSVVYADKAYCDYGIEDALKAADIYLKPLRKKNSKRQYPPWEVYLQHTYRKRVETSNSLIEQLLPKSIHAVTADGFELKVFLFIIATNIKQLSSDGINSRKSRLFFRCLTPRLTAQRVAQGEQYAPTPRWTVDPSKQTESPHFNDCCFHFESCCSLRLCRLQSSACELSPLRASSTTSALNSGVYLVRFAIGMLLSVDC